MASDSKCTLNLIYVKILSQVYYIDYGNTEQLPIDRIIPEPVLPDLSPQAVGLQFSEYLTGDIIDKSIAVVVTGPMEGGVYLATLASPP